jgi:hypothetical protein
MKAHSAGTVGLNTKSHKKKKSEKLGSRHGGSFNFYVGNSKLDLF